MADEEGGRRPRRRCASTKAAMPSAIHYVGYVEEDETPEMIMKKFEELEKVRRCQSMALPVTTLMPLCTFNTFLDADNLGKES